MFDVKRLIGIFAAMALIVAACQIGQPDPKFYLARSTSPVGKFWQVYFHGQWRDVGLDGLRPPTSLNPEVLAGDNWFLFAGAVDTVALAGIGHRELPVMMLEAWNVLWPVTRIYPPGVEPDTTRPEYLVAEDFESMPAYQRYELSNASQWWPFLVDVEYPADEVAERGYTLRRTLLDPEPNVPR